jgi:hypothetical protein
MESSVQVTNLVGRGSGTSLQGEQSGSTRPIYSLLGRTVAEPGGAVVQLMGFRCCHAIGAARRANRPIHDVSRAPLTSPANLSGLFGSLALPDLAIPIR